jgi:sterol 3beta-glucosyltransferase
MMQEHGAQVAVQTIYRELDRARSLIKKHPKQCGDGTGDFEEDWTLIEEDDEIDVSAYPFEPQQPLMGMSQDASGGGSPVLGSMILQQKRDSESAHRE